MPHRSKAWTRANPTPFETDFNPESARLDTASKSYLETCVRLWHVGDYFQVESMEKLAKDKLNDGCSRWLRCSGTVDTAKHGTTFIVDLESAIRQAWREDLAPGPLRRILTTLCIEFAPYLRRHDSFFTLLQEVPQFAVTFSKRALGSIISSRPLPNPARVADSKVYRELDDPLPKLKTERRPTPALSESVQAMFGSPVRPPGSITRLQIPSKHQVSSIYHQNADCVKRSARNPARSPCFELV